MFTYRLSMTNIYFDPQRDNMYVVVQVSVTYTLWVGSNVTENHTISVTVQFNSTFYNVMQLASLKDSHYA